MDVTLDSKSSEYISEKVRAGAFATPDDAVAGAIALMRAQEEGTADDVGELREELSTAIAQLDRGEGKPLDMESIKAQVRAEVGAR